MQIGQVQMQPTPTDRNRTSGPAKIVNFNSMGP